MGDSTQGAHGYPKKAVVDTCVLINLILGPRDSKDPQNPDRLQRSRKLVDDGMHEKLRLFLPSFALVELSTEHVLRSGRRGVPEKKMQKMHNDICRWWTGANLPIIDFAGEAAQWIHDNRPLHKLRPSDAAILASAHYLGASVVYSWDKRFIKAVEAAGGSNSLGVCVQQPPQLPLDLMSMIDEIPETPTQEE